MKTTNDIIAGDSKKYLTLHELIDQIIEQSVSQTQQKRIVIKNNVPDNLYVNGIQNKVASVIEEMLHAMINNAGEGDIDISAGELFGNTIKVAVKDNNCYNTYAVACSLQNTVQQAQEIGGFLNITNQRQKITTIEFSFPVTKDEYKQGDD